MSFVEGSVTRLTGRREYVHVGLTAAFLAADICQSSNRTLHKIGKLFTVKSLFPNADDIREIIGPGPHVKIQRHFFPVSEPTGDERGQ